MTTTTANPIYEHVTRGGKSPSGRAAMWIGLGTGILGAAAGITPLLIWDDQGIALPVSLSPLWIGLMLIAVSQPYHLIMSAVTMSQYTQSDDFVLLKLSSVSPRMMVKGFVEGIDHRLRLIRIVDMCLAPGGSVGVAAVIGPLLLGSACCGATKPSLTAMVAGYVFSLPILAGGMWVLTTITAALVQVGVWIALRWPRHARLIAAGGSAIAVMPALLLLSGLAVILGSIGSVDVASILCLAGLTPLLCLGGLIPTMAGAVWLDENAWRASTRLIKARVDAAPSPDA